MILQIFDIVGSTFSQCVDWFSSMLEYGSIKGLFLAVVFLCISVKYIIQPLFGIATFTAMSDSVRHVKEQARYHGSFEKNQTGKFLKR